MLLTVPCSVGLYSAVKNLAIFIVDQPIGEDIIALVIPQLDESSAIIKVLLVRVEKTLVCLIHVSEVEDVVGFLRRRQELFDNALE
jgi:hypothetical protein